MADTPEQESSAPKQRESWAETRLRLTQNIRDLPPEKQTELLGFLDEMDAIVTGYQTEVDQEVSNAVFEIYTLAETLGLASSDTVESMIAELEDYFSGVREAEKRLALRYDEDGWLLAWLQRNQGFVNDNLGGEIPAWVLNR